MKASIRWREHLAMSKSITYWILFAVSVVLQIIIGDDSPLFICLALLIGASFVLDASRVVTIVQNTSITLLIGRDAILLVPVAIRLVT
jgi:hypothetical protein